MLRFFSAKLAGVALLLFAFLNSHLCCGPAHDEEGEECCPMCGPGYYVYKRCTQSSTTTCGPCPPSTFMDEQNDRGRCLSCTNCNSSGGLRVKRSCTSTTDAACEPLEGHHCTSLQFNGSCRAAAAHSKCDPGQFIKQHGAASADTVCEKCVEDTYSDGSFSRCRTHTRCESRGQYRIKAGTSTSDAECGDNKSFELKMIVLITSVFVGIGVVVTVVLEIFDQVKPSKKEKPRRRTKCLLFPEPLSWKSPSRGCN
uniref:TNFR-Cys domain-containing protein n=1 Tax=Denticeps clupeoides TaxID=299321 RepID=A0AAY4B1E8_9TELE